MNKNYSVKYELVKIIFCFISIVISSFIVTNMLFNNYLDRFKKDTYDKTNQYSQLISFSIGQVDNEGKLSNISNETFKDIFKSLNSGEVSGINNSLYTISYGVYEDGTVIFSNSEFGIEENQDYINKVIEDGKIISKEENGVIKSFSPIKDKEDHILGIVQINTDYAQFYSELKYKRVSIMAIISSIVLVMSLIKISCILSRKYNKENLYKKVLKISMYVLISAIVIIFWRLDFDVSKLTQNTIKFNALSDIVMDNEENLYITDSANTRILKVDKNNKLQCEINGNNTGEGKFFYATNIEVDNSGNIYVLNNVMDDSGTYISKEGILQYDSSGNFASNIYNIEYEENDMPLMQGNILKLKNTKDALYFFIKEDQIIKVISYNYSDGELNEKFSVIIPFDIALIKDIDLGRQNESIIISSKNGYIYDIDSHSNIEILISVEDNKSFIPSEIETDDYGNIYCIDNGSSSIVKIDNNKNLVNVLNNNILKEKDILINNDSRLEHEYYKFSLNNNTITTSEHSYIISIDTESGEIKNCLNSVNYTFSTEFLKIALVICTILVVIVFMYILNLKVYDLKIFNNITKKLMECISLVLSILIISTAISGYFIIKYEDKFQTDLETNLKRISYIKSKTINGDYIEKIDSVDQYMGEDYLEIRNQITEGFNSFQDEWNLNYYSAVYKRINGKFNPVAYSDETEAFLVPLAFTENESKNIFRRVMDYETVEYIRAADYQGDWLSAFSPIKDSNGNVVAVLEIGADGNYYSIESNNIINNIVINIVSIIAVLVFLFIELNIFMEIIFNRNIKLKLKYNVKIIRFISFLIYFILNMPIFFIPIVMEKLLGNNQFFNMTNEIVIGLPLTGQMICLVIASGVGGTIADKIGWRPVFFSGIGVTVGGCLISGLINIPLAFILGVSLIGFGLGLSSIACQSFIFYVKNLGQDFDTNEILADFNSGSYAGANCGVLFGTMLYEKIGFSYTFFAAIIISVLIFFLVLRTIPNFKNMDNKLEESMNKKELFKTLFSFEILSYAVFILLPIIIVSFFVVHFFPIYSEKQGISSTAAGLGYMLQGITVIYLGPQLTKIAIKYLKPKKTVILSSLIAFGGIMFFAFSPTMLAAFITIFFLGISEAVGQSARVNYFLEMKASKLLGEGKSLAIFSVFENLGTVVGPTVFALILSYNISFGMSIYGGISLILVLIFAMSTINFKSNRNKKR